MLRRIDLRGFKSFAGHSSLEFGRGVNVIVGPNSSGKSNLAEAIVWALGEQRATRLRAGGMTDVVFSGGEGRQPAGFAEVRLLFGDDDIRSVYNSKLDAYLRVVGELEDIKMKLGVPMQAAGAAVEPRGVLSLRNPQGQAVRSARWRRVRIRRQALGQLPGPARFRSG